MKKYLLFQIAFLFANSLFAQKLPNVQEQSFKAPANVRIDGKIDEWQNRWQAYNHATDLYYSIANDEKYLYLIIKANEHTNINKILAGGIVFTINPKDKKAAMSVTYPILDFHNRVWVDLKERDEVVKSGKDTLRLADSFMNLANKNFKLKAKLIRVAGIPGVDSLISIYNQEGLKATGSFDSALNFNCELAIDLTKIGIDPKRTSKISYSIKLPGMDYIAVYKAAGLSTTLLAGRYIVAAGKLPGVTDEYVTHNQPSFPHKVHVESIGAPTDFSGEYTLAP